MRIGLIGDTPGWVPALERFALWLMQHIELAGVAPYHPLERPELHAGGSEGRMLLARGPSGSGGAA